MWLRKARRRRSFPVPVTLKHLAAPRSVFIFGIAADSSWSRRRCGAGVVGGGREPGGWDGAVGRRRGGIGGGGGGVAAVGGGCGGCGGGGGAGHRGIRRRLGRRRRTVSGLLSSSVRGEH